MLINFAVTSQAQISWSGWCDYQSRCSFKKDKEIDITAGLLDEVSEEFTEELRDCGWSLVHGFASSGYPLTASLKAQNIQHGVSKQNRSYRSFKIMGKHRRLRGGEMYLYTYWTSFKTFYSQMMSIHFKERFNQFITNRIRDMILCACFH